MDPETENMQLDDVARDRPRRRSYGDALNANLPQVRITGAMSERLAARALRENVYVSDLVRTAIAEWLDTPMSTGASSEPTT